VRFTYDTETDSISSPDLDSAQTAKIQRLLAQALYRNDPVQTVVRLMLSTAQESVN
jgi:hypothetical protein